MLAINNAVALGRFDVAVEGFGCAHRLVGSVSSTFQVAGEDFDRFETGVQLDSSRGLRQKQRQSQR